MPHHSRSACVPPQRISEQVDEADGSPDDSLLLVQDWERASGAARPRATEGPANTAPSAAISP